MPAVSGGASGQESHFHFAVVVGHGFLATVAGATAGIVTESLSAIGAEGQGGGGAVHAQPVVDPGGAVVRDNHAGAAARAGAGFGVKGGGGCGCGSHFVAPGGACGMVKHR